MLHVDRRNVQKPLMTTIGDWQMNGSPDVTKFNLIIDLIRTRKQ